MKVAVVGEAPSRFMHEAGITTPLILAGRELAALAGVWWPGEWDEVFDVYNVLPAWPGKSGKGDAFPISVARPLAAKLRRALLGRPLVVLLGKRVAQAWGVGHLDWFVRCGTVVVAPHPSHVNRWWNSAANRVEAARFWRGVAKEARDAARRGPDQVRAADRLASPEGV